MTAKVMLIRLWAIEENDDMHIQVEKTKENRSRPITNAFAYKKSNIKTGFGYLHDRHKAMAQRKNQEIINNRQMPNLAFSIGQVIQKSDDHFDSDTDTDTDDEALANNVMITDPFADALSSVWLCGGAVAGQHQEVICVIGNRGFLRFSRNNASDTAMSTQQARLPIIVHYDVANLTVGDAVNAYNAVHDLWPQYEQADCQDFAQELIYRLTGNHALNHGGDGDDDFM